MGMVKNLILASLLLYPLQARGELPIWNAEAHFQMNRQQRMVLDEIESAGKKLQEILILASRKENLSKSEKTLGALLKEVQSVRQIALNRLYSSYGSYYKKNYTAYSGRWSKAQQNQIDLQHQNILDGKSRMDLCFKELGLFQKDLQNAANKDLPVNLKSLEKRFEKISECLKMSEDSSQDAWRGYGFMILLEKMFQNLEKEKI